MLCTHNTGCYNFAIRNGGLSLLFHQHIISSQELLFLRPVPTPNPYYNMLVASNESIVFVQWLLDQINYVGSVGAPRDAQLIGLDVRESILMMKLAPPTQQAAPE